MELVEVIVKEGPGKTDVDKYNYPRDRRDKEASKKQRVITSVTIHDHYTG